MTFFKNSTISVLIIALCIFAVAGCSRENTSSNNVTDAVSAEDQTIENEDILFTDFTNTYESEVAQLGDFVIRDEMLVLYTGSSRHVNIPAELGIKGIVSAFAHGPIISVNIPEDVEIIEGAFYNCYQLQTITVAPNNRHFTAVDGVLYNKAVTELVHFPQGKSGSFTIPNTITMIDWRFFSGCSNLTTINIPASVVRIDDHAFSSCTSLESFNVDGNNSRFASVDGVLFNRSVTLILWVPQAISGSFTIPGTVTTIDERAFSNRRGLTSITIPNSVTDIGINAFSNCTGLTTINIPRYVTHIGDSAFGGCANLTSVTVNANNADYASIDGVLYNKYITELVFFPIGKTGSFTLPNTIMSIRSYAFTERTGLTSITIPASVESIGENAFFGCTALTSINVDANNAYYASIDGVLFNKYITELIRFPRGKSGQYVIPNTIISIEKNAFAGASRLTAVTIPIGVISIGDTAFAGTGLSTLTLPNSVENIGYGAFADNPNLTVIGLPDNYYAYGNGKGGEYFFYGCTGLQQILASSNNRNYSTVDGVLFNKDRTVLIRFPQGRTGSYTLPSTVTSIAYKAFYGSSLNSINIPSSVTTIGDFAFDGSTNLISVNIPDSVTDVGRYAFARCTNLTTVNIPASVISLGEFAFYNTRLRQLNIDQNNPSYILANGMLLRRDGIEVHRYLAALVE